MPPIRPLSGAVGPGRYGPPMQIICRCEYGRLQRLPQSLVMYPLARIVEGFAFRAGKYQANGSPPRPDSGGRIAQWCEGNGPRVCRRSCVVQRTAVNFARRSVFYRRVKRLATVGPLICPIVPQMDAPVPD